MQSNLTANDFHEIVLDSDGNKKISLSRYKLPAVRLVIKANTRAEVLLSDFKVQNDIEVVLEENAFLKLKIITNNIEKVINLHEKLAKSSSFSCYFADFSSSNIAFKNTAALGYGSNFEFDVSCLANQDNKKIFEISCTHVEPYATSNIEFYGVSLLTGSIDMKGVSTINENCIKSNANQSCKIILFDKESRGFGSPTLKIDCDDVKASHGCAIGSLNEDHIFYLKTRGLTENEARKLITLGYLEPIKRYFNENETKIIDDAIKGGFNFD